MTASFTARSNKKLKIIMIMKNNKWYNIDSRKNGGLVVIAVVAGVIIHALIKNHL